jgi:hypothetical protein
MLGFATFIDRAHRPVKRGVRAPGPERTSHKVRSRPSATSTDRPTKARSGDGTRHARAIYLLARFADRLEIAPVPARPSAKTSPMAARRRRRRDPRAHGELLCDHVLRGLRFRQRRRATGCVRCSNIVSPTTRCSYGAARQHTRPQNTRAHLDVLRRAAN